MPLLTRIYIQDLPPAVQNVLFWSEITPSFLFVKTQFRKKDWTKNPLNYILKIPKMAITFMEVKRSLILVQSILWLHSDPRLSQCTQRLHIRRVDHGCVLNSEDVWYVKGNRKNPRIYHWYHRFSCGVSHRLLGTTRGSSVRCRMVYGFSRGFEHIFRRRRNCILAGAFYTFWIV